MELRTKKDVTRYMWYKRVTIPVGTLVKPASNLPEDPNEKVFWACPWNGISDEEQAWSEVYGFLIGEDDVD